MWKLIVAWEGSESWMTADHPSQGSCISQREKLLRDVRRGRIRRGVKWTAIVHVRESYGLNGSRAPVVAAGTGNGHETPNGYSTK